MLQVHENVFIGGIVVAGVYKRISGMAARLPAADKQMMGKTKTKVSAQQLHKQIIRIQLDEFV